MSEPNQDGQGAPVGDVQPLEGQGAPSGEAEPKTFDEAYVTKLRSEAAEHRVKASRADELAEGWYRSAVELATAGVLVDPSDLPRSDDHFDPETGRPNVEKIRAAAEELANAKPHLARARVPAAQLQGPVGQQPAQVGLGSLLRQAAS